MNELWQRAADRMRGELGEVGYETWIGPLNFVGHQGSTVTIEAPNRFFRDWINERYLGLMRSALTAEAGEQMEVRLTLGETGVAAPQQRPINGHSNGNGNGSSNGHSNGNGTATSKTPMAHHARESQPAPRGDRHPTLNPRYTFAEFVVGSANQFAHAAAQAVANQPGEKYNPLFIYGGVGLGKTHLVTALGHHIWASGDRPRKVLFMPAEIFMNELINSLRRDKMGEFREKFRRVDTLILDDVQFLAGRELTVGVIERPDGLITLPCIEIEVDPGFTFDYEGKYLGKGTREICPANISDSLAAEAQRAALEAHTALGCEGYSRSDFVAGNDRIWFLELNTLPGLTTTSLVPQQLRAAGIELATFLDEQEDLARGRAHVPAAELRKGLLSSF